MRIWAALATANIPEARARWLRWLAAQPCGEGTHDGYCRDTGAPLSSSGRPRECAEAGWCEDTGMRAKSRSGAMARVWRITEAGRGVVKR